MNDESTGVVLVTQFVLPEENTYGSYINYINRSNATRQKNSKKFVEKSLVDELNYSGYAFDYMGDSVKTTDLFTSKIDHLEPEQLKDLKKLFEKAQNNGSPMWQSVISFDNHFLDKYGIYNLKDGKLDEDRIRTITRSCMKNMLDRENLSKTAIYTASIHYNTDNIHVHIATVEPVPTRALAKVRIVTIPNDFIQKYRILDNENDFKTEKAVKVTTYKGGYDRIYKKLTDALLKDGIKLNLGNYIKINKDHSISITYRGKKDQVPKFIRYSVTTGFKGRFSRNSIYAAKSAIVSEIMQDKNPLIELNNILRENIIQKIGADKIYFDSEITSAFTTLLNNLPTDSRKWIYGSPSMANLRTYIDEITKLCIDKYFSEEFQTALAKLKEIDLNYKKAYGSSKNRNYMENKLKDFYIRCGNRILNVARDIKKGNSIAVHNSDSAPNFVSIKRFSFSKYKATYNSEFKHKNNFKKNYSFREKKEYYNKFHHLEHLAFLSKYDINAGLRDIKRGIGNECDHFKNQMIYEQLMFEQSKNAEYEL